MSGVSWRNPIAIGFAALGAVIVAAATFSVVPETKQAVVLRFEQPGGPATRWRPDAVPGRHGPGPSPLHLKH